MLHTDFMVPVLGYNPTSDTVSFNSFPESLGCQAVTYGGECVWVPLDYSKVPACLSALPWLGHSPELFEHLLGTGY